MAASLETYRKKFRESYVEDQKTLLGIHVLIYAVVNALWVVLNMMAVPHKYRWLMFYPIIGWGLLIFIHWWFYVRKSESLCRIKEERAITGMEGETKEIGVS